MDAYFNRVCAYSLLQNSTTATQDLPKAIEIDSEFRYLAKTDSNFDNIRNTPGFKKMKTLVAKEFSGYRLTSDSHVKAGG